ncbi:MAG: hypothetical protein NDF54_04090 [archaeon GB-1867-035]|nr:hypothetical protein [Candidatus Culexmicrobium profundum]
MDILFEKPEFLKKEDEVTIKIKSDRNLIQLYNRLLRIYQTKYPHNPEGVLRFHISRQLKFEKDKDLELILRKLLRNIKHK